MSRDRRKRHSLADRETVCRVYELTDAPLAVLRPHLVNGWLVQKLDELLPWAWPEQIGASLAA